MADHRKKVPTNESEEWLNLETAVELIGQRIAGKVLLFNEEKGKDSPDTNLLGQLKTEILELGRERQACYRPETQQETIQKALTEYATKRKSGVWTVTELRTFRPAARPKSRHSAVAGAKESSKV